MATIVLTGGVLLDGTGSAPLPDATVIIEGEEIVAVGRRCEIPLPPQPYELYDLAGQYVLPGLIDAHVHVTIDGGPSGTFSCDEHYNVLAALKQAQRTLEAGFTTVRDLGGRNHIEFAVRRAIQEGLYPGPRLVLAGKIISMTSAGADYWPGMYREADGPDQVRKATREELKAGADVIKVMATGAAMAPGEQPAAQYTVQEMRAAVEEAHKVGKPVAAHASGIEGIRNALAAGVDHIEHGSYLHEDPAAIEQMIARGVFLVPTRKAFAAPLATGAATDLPEWMLRQIRREEENSARSLRAAIAAGVAIAMGTDAGGPFNRHGENAGELQLLVE
ncbi:MAG: amidohydrolase family protein, partial [Anaerolineae bacterium]|nr:amidohydrolase family protein [Anaerolineae bacterium]